MTYLIISIFCVTGLFISFKVIQKYGYDLTTSILISYMVSLLFSLSGIGRSLNWSLFHGSWIAMAMVTAGFFIFNFFFIGLCTRQFGVAITSVANKLSLIIPAGVSMLIDPADRPTGIKITGIALSLVAIVLLLYPGKGNEQQYGPLWIPAVLFFGIGTADSLLKIAQVKFLSEPTLPLFVTAVFFFCLIYAIILFVLKKISLHQFLFRNNWIAGLLLGITNWGAFITLMLALNHPGPDGTTINGSVLFGINNLGIVSLSVISGFFIFREKLSNLNWSGVWIALAAIFILSFLAA